MRQRRVAESWTGRSAGTSRDLNSSDFNALRQSRDMARTMLHYRRERDRARAERGAGRSTMNRSTLALAFAAAASAVSFAGERQAGACGGCFHPPTQTVTDITDERMLLSVSSTQSTLFDQIQYQGSPTSFAWVLPIHGTVTVGLSADVLFNSMDTLTATQINPPPQNCPSPNCSTPSANAAFGGSGTSGGGSPVQILAQANVGPYATVQLHSSDSSALDAWLTSNGFNIPAAVQPILDAYIKEGFDFLAMKLLPNQGVQAMRPVRVTTPGASLSLPLRMASIGTGAITGITIWVVADGRYEPQNFPFFHIDDSELVWDWNTNASNYTTLRTQKEAASKNAAWEIESSISLNQEIIKNVIESGGQYYGNGLASGPAVDATQDYLPIGDADAGASAGDAGYESAEQVRDDDINTLLAGQTGSTVRVTRIRSDIAQTAMTSDFVLKASADQSELSNIRTVTQSVNLTCTLYNGCQAVGTGTLAQAQASVNRGGGCATSARGTGSRGAAFGALAGVLALLAGRAIRMRRRRR